MLDRQLLAELLDGLTRPVARYAYLESYYYGTQANGFLTKDQRELLGKRLSHLAVGIPKLAITSLAERLKVIGFDGADVWDDWQRLNLDAQADIVHREALTLGTSYVCVWSRDGKPFATAESAHDMAVIKGPGDGTILAAVKRWETETTTEATVFLPDVVYRLRADRKGVTTEMDFRVVESLENPLGVVPVVEFANADRFQAVSEIDGLADLVDGLNLALADLAVAQAFYARPVSWATGVSLVEVPVLDDDGQPVIGDDGEPVVTVENPFPPANRMHISESENAKFGQLSGSDLAGFEAAVRIWLSALQAVTSLPASYLGILSDQPTSADAIRAAAESLTAKAQNRAGIFGRSWSQVAALIVAVRDGVAVESVQAQPQWQDFATRSEAQLADATVKLYEAGLLSRSGALRRMGYSESEILAERASRRAESLDTVGVSIDTANPVNASQRGAEAR